ncbi:MAG: 2-amino-4-hydroxy-6-hydroxymethyldihydropteridine diphosphokinase [Bacteroidota bacterium]
MVRAFLLLGSNQGDRMAYLEKACHEIGAKAGRLITMSSVYQTAAWGVEDQPAFLNQVMVIETGLSPAQLLTTVLGIETMLGRVRSEKWGSRIIDIDILFYGDQIVETPELLIPHPRIAERRFALVPMAEVDAEFVHPVFGKNIRMLLRECKDGLAVTRVIGNR